MSIVWNTYFVIIDCGVDLAFIYILCDIGFGIIVYIIFEVYGGLGRSGYLFI